MVYSLVLLRLSLLDLQTLAGVEDITDKATKPSDLDEVFLLLLAGSGFVGQISFC